jgi:hypothetical protein
MAWATKCDRCGKYYKYRDGVINGVTLLSYDRKSDEYFIKGEEDICPDCVKSFNEWFIEGQKGGKR